MHSNVAEDATVPTDEPTIKPATAISIFNFFIGVLPEVDRYMMSIVRRSDLTVIGGGGCQVGGEL